MKKIIILLLLGVSICTYGTKKISINELEDKIAGAWIGQMIGNIYGLPFENKYITAPAPEKWPYGYTKNLDKLEKTGGAFSDDDTDFEYLYLIQMEKYGCEPTYANLREAWMYHVRDRVWLANRATLGLMHHGYTPPFTGMKSINPHWFQIDPQLINEIWAYTAPGMATYAAQKSDWAARITSDDWAAHPTMHYGAMYANAFFETDIERLILKSLKEIPENSRYAQTIKHMIALHKKYPTDWKAARQEMANEYYINEPAMTKTIWNANLNGACGILSMLYGNGDFQRTLDLGCAMGFDADNQTATVSGIMGVMYGLKSLPKELYLPVKGWTKPFNDKYFNVTRYDLPDGVISDMIKRTVKQAINVTTKNGGKIKGEGKQQQLIINDRATFKVPLEFYIGPNPRLEVNNPISFNYFCDANKNYTWKLKDGKLPEGLKFNNGTLSGTPIKEGKSTITLTLSDGEKNIEKEFELIVRGKNIAQEAEKIICNISKLNMNILDSCWYTFGKPMYATDINVINDGVFNGVGSVFYTIAAKSNLPKIDYMGYSWKEARKINALSLYRGCMEEFGGWWNSLNIQYQNEKGDWVPVPAFTSSPALPTTDIVFYQPNFVEYLLQFPTIETKAIRILCDAKVETHWCKYTNEVSSFLSVTELSVYQPQ